MESSPPPGVLGVQHGKPVIGLVGGIGAGKSAVAAEFERQGCLVIDSDRLGRAALDEPAVLATLQSWWGTAVVKPDGGADRSRIAEIVFTAEAERRRLESLLHPLIAARRAAIITAVEDNPAVTAIVIDSPLLLESNLDRECDSIVFVNTSDGHRLRRVQAARGWTAEELKRREARQIPLAEKRTRAEFCVDNDGSVARLRPQVADILQTILKRLIPG
jgi:dephospho-CoA kinase